MEAGGSRAFLPLRDRSELGPRLLGCKPQASSTSLPERGVGTCHSQPSVWPSPGTACPAHRASVIFAAEQSCISLGVTQDQDGAQACDCTPCTLDTDKAEPGGQSPGQRSLAPGGCHGLGLLSQGPF